MRQRLSALVPLASGYKRATEGRPINIDTALTNASYVDEKHRERQALFLKIGLRPMHL